MTALFAQSGVIRVDTVAELFDVGRAAGRTSRCRPAAGSASSATPPRWPTLAATACRANGLTVAAGYPRERRAAGRPRTTSPTRSPTPRSIRRWTRCSCVFAPPLPGQLVDEDADFAAALASVALAGDRPTVATFLVGRPPAGVPSYPSVEEAVRALARVVGYADWLRQPPGVLPDLPGIDRDAARAALADGEPGLAERLLAAYGIPVVPSAVADSAAAAVAAARERRVPGGAQGGREGLRHRLDLGAVRLDRADDAAVRQAYREIAEPFGAGGAGAADGRRRAWPAWWRWSRIRPSGRWSASGWAGWRPSCSATGPGGRRR